jgi:tRNA uridine 5-carbamoylmethylation protein Kti12
MITIVTGPPCSGKSTYIKENAKPDDCIIDMDRIALALSPDETTSFNYSERIRKIARSARAAAVKTALMQAQGERYWGLWIIHTDPTPDVRSMYRSFGARFVEMNPGKVVCLERLTKRPIENQKLAREVIDTYYGKRNEN